MSGTKQLAYIHILSSLDESLEGRIILEFMKLRNVTAISCQLIRIITNTTHSQQKEKAIIKKQNPTLLFNFNLSFSSFMYKIYSLQTISWCQDS